MSDAPACRSRGRAWSARVAAMLALAAYAPAGAAQARPPASPMPAVRPGSGVRLGTAVAPDTLTVGDPITVTLRVEVSAGATVTFPAAPDSGGAVDALAPMRDTAIVNGATQDVRAVYRLAAWDVGALDIPLGNIVVRDADGRTREVAPGALRVVVRSVLPAAGDTVPRDPKPPRAPVADAGLWWWPLALALLVALLVVGLLGWLIVRALRRQKPAAAAPDAYDLALDGFARLDAQRLVPAGETGRHVALGVEVLRDYLAARLPGAALALTGPELVAAIGGRDEVPTPRLERLLGFADLVKFAARRPSPDEATRAAGEARLLVEEVERAVRAREAREAAEAVARAAAEAEERRRYEEEARQRARRSDRERAA